MAKGLLIIAVLAVVLAVVYWLAPDDRRYEVRYVLGLVGNEKSIACLEAVKTNGLLNNSPSAQLLSSSPRQDGGVFITYRNKNRFGAWVTDHFICNGRDLSSYAGQVWTKKADELLAR